MQGCCHRRDHGEVCRHLVNQRRGVRALGTLPFLPKAWGARTGAPLYFPFPDMLSLQAPVEGRRQEAAPVRQTQVQVDHLILAMRGGENYSGWELSTAWRHTVTLSYQHLSLRSQVLGC